MHKVARGQLVKIGGIEYKSGRKLPEGKDYSTLIQIGKVIESKEQKIKKSFIDVEVEQRTPVFNGKQPKKKSSGKRGH